MKTPSPAIRAVMLAALPLCASAAHARLFWDHPGRDPYAGTLREAGRLFIENGVPARVADQQFRMFDQGLCHVGRLRDDQLVDLMLFGAGHVLRNVIAETALWKPSIPRRAVVCPVRAGGWAFRLIVPAVCHNYSEEIRRLPGYPPAPFLGAPFAPPAIGFGGWHESGGAWAGMAFASVGIGGGFGIFSGGLTPGPGPRSSVFTLPPSRIPAPETVLGPRSPRLFRRAVFALRRHHRFPGLTLSVPPIVPAPPGTPATPIPEPGTLPLLLAAVGLLAAFRAGRRM